MKKQIVDGRAKPGHDGRQKEGRGEMSWMEKGERER
jgi:hypothetical protein